MTAQGTAWLPAAAGKERRSKLVLPVGALAVVSALVSLDHHDGGRHANLLCLSVRKLSRPARLHG